MKRKDGVRLKNVDPLYEVAAHIMKDRCDSLNCIRIDIPVEPLQKYIRKQKNENDISISHLGLFLAAFVRTLAEYPQLNRFIVNKRFYQRNEIAIGMVVLQPGTDDGETMSKMYFEKTDDIFTIQKKIDDYISHNREAEAENATEKILRILKFPGVLRAGVCIIKFLDKHNLLPKSVIDMSPFHATMTITNLGSIRTNYIYHHVYNFGTTSMIFSMGQPVEVPKRKKGEIVFERCIPCGLEMDERIAHGSYFAIAFKRFAQYLEHPELLEGPPPVVNEDCG